MSTKKLINDLLQKLKSIEDPIEREDLEEQILQLAEQEEAIENMEKLNSVPSIKTDHDLNKKVNPTSELEPEEKIRLERQLQRQAKEEQYRTVNQLETSEEELLRTEMLNHALASNDEYAYRKEHRSTGAKNKNKKIYKTSTRSFSYSNK